MPFKIKNKPIRTVLRWQAYTTAVLALIAGIWAGLHGAVSALLGGFIGLSAGFVYGIMISGQAKTAGETLLTLFRAEAGKIGWMVFLLWLVLATYKDVVLVAFFAAFASTVLVFQMAIIVRDSTD